MPIKIEDFPQHLSTLKQGDWAKLFGLCAEISMTQSFGEAIGEVKNNGSSIAPHWEEAPVVTKFRSIVDELDIMIIFDWQEWDRAEEIFQDENFDYNSLDVLTLCQLITCLIQADRAHQGVLIGAFRDRVIMKIILALYRHVGKPS